MHKGLHLTIDGIVSEPDRVFTHENLDSLFKKLVEKLEMTMILGPIFKDVPFEPEKMDSKVFKDEGGTSAFCLISTSHITAHLWPLRGVFQMDIFSCKMFDEKAALEVVQQELSTTKLKFHKIIRRQYA